MTVTDPATGSTPGTVQDEAASPGTEASTEAAAPSIVEELLVEEISIDGMCGVY